MSGLPACSRRWPPSLIISKNGCDTFVVAMQSRSIELTNRCGQLSKQLRDMGAELSLDVATPTQAASEREMETAPHVATPTQPASEMETAPDSLQCRFFSPCAHPDASHSRRSSAAATESNEQHAAVHGGSARDESSDAEDVAAYLRELMERATLAEAQSELLRGGIVGLVVAAVGGIELDSEGMTANKIESYRVLVCC
jgi:hypothetical protein